MPGAWYCARCAGGPALSGLGNTPGNKILFPQEVNDDGAYPIPLIAGEGVLDSRILGARLGNGLTLCNGQAHPMKCILCESTALPGNLFCEADDAQLRDDSRTQGRDRNAVGPFPLLKGSSSDAPRSIDRPERNPHPARR